MSKRTFVVFRTVKRHEVYVAQAENEKQAEEIALSEKPLTFEETSEIKVDTLEQYSTFPLRDY